MNRQAYEPDRVRRNTSNWVLDRIEHGIECSIYHYYRRPHEEIALRIEDLDHEWDIERVLEANAAVIALAGTFLGITVSRKYLLVPCVVLGFLVQHAVQG